MDVVPRDRGAGLAVVAKRLFQILEQVGLRAEMAEVLVAAIRLLRHLGTHFAAVVAVKRIALDVDGVDALAVEDLLEGAFDRGRARARGTRDRNDRMLSGHATSLLTSGRSRAA